MMKFKIFFHVVLLYGFILSFVSAISYNDVLKDITKLKSVYLSQSGLFLKFEKEEKSKLQNKLNNIYDNFKVKLLLDLDKIEKSDLLSGFEIDVKNLKIRFIDDINYQLSKLYLLKEKKDYDLIDTGTYNQQLDVIKLETNLLSGKYFNVLSGLVNAYDEKIKDLSGSISKILKQNKYVFKLIQKKERYLKDLLVRYEEFNQLYNKVSKLFLGSNDFIGFINKIQNNYINILESMIDKVVNKYYTKYPWLKYYGEEIIKNYKEKLVNSYIKDLKDYLNSLVDVDISEEKVNKLKDIVFTLKDKYYLSENNIDYRNLYNDDYIFTVYKSTLQNLNNIIEKLNNKLAFYSFPNDEEQFKLTLKNKIYNYMKDKLTLLLNDIKSYIDNVLPSIKEKYKKSNIRYQILIDTYYYCDTLTGANVQYNCLDNLEKEIIKSKELIKEPNKWSYLQQIEDFIKLKKIDLLIKINNLERFEYKYKNLEDKFYNAIINYGEKYQNKNKFDKFINKLYVILYKIDKRLQNNKLTLEEKYIYLVLKKSIIRYLNFIKEIQQ